MSSSGSKINEVLTCFGHHTDIGQLRLLQLTSVNIYVLKKRR
jgi:hypothetical protein